MVLLTFSSLVLPQKTNAASLDELTIAGLEARLTRLTCKINFAMSQVDIFAENVPSAPDLSSHKEKLSSDLTALQGYAQQGDVSGFNIFVSGTFKQDMQSATTELNNAKGKLNTYGFSITQLRSVLLEFKSNREDYTKCLSSAVLSVAQKNLDYIKYWITTKETVVTTMTEKGYDTSEMQTILNSVKTNVIAPLETAVATGDSEKILQATKDARSKYLHSWARFNISHLNQYVNRLEEADTEDQYSSEISAIKNNITAANSIVAQGEKYTENQFQQVYNYLTDASSGIKELAKKMQAK